VVKPETDSGVDVKESACRRSVDRFTTPKESAHRITAALTAVRTGRFSARAQTPRPAGCVLPNSGTRGQNTLRPNDTSTAGKSVSIVSNVAAIPMAPMTPTPEMSFISATNRHASPSATVDPDARIAGPTPRSAACIAACGSRWPRSCSR
jgi:hypothetical protein